MKLFPTVVAAILVLSACGGDGGGGTAEAPGASSSGSSVEAVDVCGLIDQAVVDALFEGNPPPGEADDVTGPGGTSGGQKCKWDVGLSGLTVSAFISNNFLTPQDLCSYCEDIEGLGDKAWGGVSDRGRGGTLVAVDINGRGVQALADGLDLTVDQLVELMAPVIEDLS